METNVFYGGQSALNCPVGLKANVESVLEMGLESAAGQCSFAYSKTYRPHEAPNPRLFIEGPGKLESPSTEADALALISACAPQRDGSGIVNSGVWEIAASKVRFLNPAWQSWIRDVAGATVLDGLRASCVDNSVDYIFNKLLIHDANSQLQCEATVIAKDQMGSLVVLLPSRFTGGTLGLRHDGQVKHMDLSGQSDVATSIVASYAGVEQTMSQVTSGYRLSLVYDITHRGPRPPTLEDLDSPKQRLRRIMRVWKEDLNAPRVLACLLRNKYFPGVTFDATALTGSDAVLLSTLHSLSREMQFSVYLAHIEVSVSMNTAADSSGACDYSADWSEESFADVEVEDLTITQILDLDGIPVEVQGLPRLSTSDLVNGPDAILHQSESVLQEDLYWTEIYRRTVVLLWPGPEAGLTVGVGANILRYALEVLGGSNFAMPTRKEQRLVEKLLDWCAREPKDEELIPALNLLWRGALRWHDVNIFFSMMVTCGFHKIIAFLGVDIFPSAYRAFGWDSIRDFCTITVKNEPTNRSLWALLMRLAELAREEDDLELQIWVHENRSIVLRSLHRVKPGEMKGLIDFIIFWGGELNTHIIPQLEGQALPEADFWVPFLRSLYQNRKSIASANPDAVDAVINRGVELIVTRLPAFPRITANDEHEEADWARILNIISLCLDIDRPALLANIAQRMRETAFSGDYTPQFPPWPYYIQIAHALDNTYPERSELHPFFEDTVISLLSPIGWLPDGQSMFPCKLTPQILTVMMKAVKGAGGPPFLEKLTHPEMLHGRDYGALQEFTCFIVKGLKPVDGDLIKHKMVTAFLADTAVDAFDIQSSGYSEMLDVVKFCVQVEAPTATHERFLMRMLSVLPGTVMVRYLTSVLVPFLLRLPNIISESKTEVRTGAAFQLFATTVLKLFAEKKMTPRPVGAGVIPLERVEYVCCDPLCKWNECRDLAEFVKDGRPGVIVFKRAKPIRTHLEQNLAKARVASFGFSLLTIINTSPHTLQVKKPDNIAAFGKWYANHLTGKQLLVSLGSTEEQKRVLGKDRDRIVQAIEGEEARPPLASLGVNQVRTGQKRGRDATEFWEEVPLGSRSRLL